MDVPASLQKALEEVQTASESTLDAKELAKVVRPLLEAAIAEISSSTVSRPSRRGTGPINYVVERTQQGEVLTENRVGGRSKPFRCPTRVYEYLVLVLSEADRPLAMDEIMLALEERMGERPADHQVRVPLRLWMHVDPPLIRRSRARYSLNSRDSFLSTAKHLWRQLNSV
jgi:hypothetical protein